MASSKAKKEAKSTLGTFDTSAYDTGRSAAKSIYDTSVADAENQWTNLQEKLTSSRKASATDFAKGRSNVAESNYLANRADLNRRAAGGTTASGFNSMNNLGDRMELGRQYSNLANTYYKALEGIDRDQTQGEQAYNMALRQAGDIYNSALANLDLAQQGAQNEYKAALANLAEGIQSRWDANANAAASLQAQKEQWDKDYKRTRDQYAGNLIRQLQGNLTRENLANTIKNLHAADYTYDEIKKYLDLYGINYNQFTSGNSTTTTTPVIKWNTFDTNKNNTYDTSDAGRNLLTSGVKMAALGPYASAAALMEAISNRYK